MKKYTVGITDAAFFAIREQARHIAVRCRAPENAKRWLEQVWDAVDSLERFPRKVWIVGLRHGHRLARPEDLPADPGPPEE